MRGNPLWGALRALAWLGVAASAPLSAQEAVPCQLCVATIGNKDAPTTPVRLDLETSLNFDRLVLTGPGGGVAQLRPDGSAAASGAVEMSGRAMVGTANIHGEPGRAVRVELPDRIALHGHEGGQIVIEELTTDLPAMPRLDSAGRLQFRFGGALRVMGDAEGAYRGDVAITVDYL